MTLSETSDHREDDADEDVGKAEEENVKSP